MSKLNNLTSKNMTVTANTETTQQYINISVKTKDNFDIYVIHATSENRKKVIEYKTANGLAKFAEKNNIKSINPTINKTTSKNEKIELDLTEKTRQFNDLSEDEKNRIVDKINAECPELSNEKNETVLTVRLEQELSDQLTDRAKATKTTKAKLVRKLIKNEVAYNRLRENEALLILEKDELTLIKTALETYLTKKDTNTSDNMSVYFYISQELSDLNVSLNKQLYMF